MKTVKHEQQELLLHGRTLLRMRCVLVALAVVLAPIGSAFADDIRTIEVLIKDHRFSPAEIHIRVGEPVILHLRNNDPTPEEFDSSALKVEKVIVGGGVAKIRLRPLGPGRYPFIGEYHADTAQGVVIAE
jgi:hypothetical protein